MVNTLQPPGAAPIPNAPRNPSAPTQTDNLMRMSQAETNRNQVRSITIGEGNGRCVLYPAPLVRNYTDVTDYNVETYSILTQYGPREIHLINHTTTRTLNYPERLQKERRNKFLALLEKAKATGTIRLDYDRKDAYSEHTDEKGVKSMGLSLPDNLNFYGKKLPDGKYGDGQMTESKFLTQNQAEALNKR